MRQTTVCVPVILPHHFPFLRVPVPRVQGSSNCRSVRSSALCAGLSHTSFCVYTCPVCRSQSYIILRVHVPCAQVVTEMLGSTLDKTTEWMNVRHQPVSAYHDLTGCQNRKCATQLEIQMHHHIINLKYHTSVL